ncbi:TniQ family protein [Marinimicrobium sp. C2-29]|uniref:TniQ family protein n=1 Tax=Marinimicrobium sp. C2-29 TaxID=3139825 RepID=UPI00405345E0
MNRKISFFPTPLPDEHIVSALIRYLRLSGKRNLSSGRNHITRDYQSLDSTTPWRVAYIDIYSVFQDTLSVEEFANKYTLWPFFKPFISSEVQSSVIGMKWVPDGKKRFTLTSTVQNHSSLCKSWRWCIACASSDYDRYGITYWHREHQLPNVLHCRHHNRNLDRQCPHCEQSIWDIYYLPLPSPDGLCRFCHRSMLDVDFTSPQSEALSDIERMGLSALFNHNNANLDKTINGMRKLLNDLIHQRISELNISTRISRIQVNKEFRDFISNDPQLESIFARQGENDYVPIQRPKDSLLHIVESGSGQSAISYIAAMRFLMKERDIPINDRIWEG